MKKSNSIPGNFHLYISACHRDGGIYRYHLSADGQAAFTEKIPLPSPMYHCVDDKRLHVLLRAPWEDRNDSAYLSIPLSDGTPTELRSTEGVVACHLSLLGDSVYAANYLSGNLIRLSLSPPEETDVVTHHGSSVHPTRQTEPHTHYINPIPGTELLAAVDLGLDCIFVYNSRLQPVSELRLPGGCGPRHLAWSEDGSLAFCACELSSEVMVLSRCGEKLHLLSRCSSLPAGVSPEEYDNTASAIRCHGDLVAVSNRGHDSVSFFRADSAGTLTWLGNVSAGGKSPRDFDIFGPYLVCTNEKSDSVTIQKLTQSNAEICAVLTDEIRDIPAPLCVTAVPVL